METLVIVGTGHAANALISSLTRHGFKGRIILVGDELHPPYNRPPLSKKFLSDEILPSELYVRGVEQLAKHGFEVRLRVRATDIDPREQTVSLSSGETLHYSKLVLATGSTPRTLPSDVDRTHRRVHVLRGIEDALIGAGYVGLEVEASCAMLGKEVRVIEAAPCVLARVAGPELSGIVQRTHEAHGVSFSLQSSVSQVVEGLGGFEITLAGDEQFTSDLVLCAIGATPNTELAVCSGIEVNRGIFVNAQCQTSVPGIYAVGDCATFYREGELVRLESVQNASDQADVVARHLCGLEAEYKALPWFWSDQYDMRLQSVGLANGSDGSLLRSQANSHAIWHHRDGQIIALDTINAPRDHMLARKLMSRGPIHFPALRQAEFDLSRIGTMEPAG